MTTKSTTAVIYLYCDEHARSAQNFENFAANGLVNNVDFFVAGSKINLSRAQHERSKFREIYFENGEDDHKKISWFYNNQIKKSDYQSLVVLSSRMSGPHATSDGVNNWVQRFVERLTIETHLVGSNIIMLPLDHPLTILQNENQAEVGIASYIPTSAFAISREALDFLETKCFFNQEIPPCEISFQFLYEMRMSNLLLENGWNISCLLSKYSNVDFRSTKKDPNPTSWLGNPSIRDCYFNSNIDNVESIFVETPNFEADQTKSHLNPPKNAELYGIFYDELSRSTIPSGFIPLDNSKGPRHLYESYPMVKQLEQSPPKNDMWLGFFSPKFTQKTRIEPHDVFFEIQQADKDVSVILFSSHWKQVALWPNIWLQGHTYHPGLLDLTNKLIELADYKTDVTKIYSTLNDGVFSNYLVAKSEFWLEWQRLVTIYFQIITQNDRLLQKSTPYLGNTVPIHTFVIERLASLIILELGLKTKFSQNLYNRSLNFNSVNGSAAITMNWYKSKFIETGDVTYKKIYDYHVNKINERNKKDLAKRLLAEQKTSRVA